MKHSINYRFGNYTLGAFFIGLLALAVAWASPARAASPEAFVQALADQAVAILKDSSLDQTRRYEAFRSLILANTDLDRVAGFALGQYGRDMRATNRYDEYASLFREYVVRIYASRLGQYSGEALEVTRSLPHGTDQVIVYSRVAQNKSGGDPILVNWRLRRSGAEYKIIDVQIAGAWMAIEQQEQFTSIITNNNRQATAIIDFLRNKLAATAPGGNAS